MTSLEQGPKFEKPRTHGWKGKCLALALLAALSGTPLKTNSQNLEKVSPKTERVDKKATDPSDAENNANILKDEGLEVITLSGNVTAILVKQFLAMQEYVFQNATPLLENNATISGKELMNYIEADEEVQECNFFFVNDNETYFNIEGISVDLDTSDGNFKVEGNTITINGSAIIDVRKSNGDRIAICFNHGYDDFRIGDQSGNSIETPSDRTLYLGREFVEELGSLPGDKPFSDNNKVTLPKLKSGETLPNSVIGFDEQGQHPEIGNDLFLPGEGEHSVEEVLKRVNYGPSSTEIIDLGNGEKLIVDNYDFKFLSSDGGMSAGASVSPEKRRIAVVREGLAPVEVNIENEGVGGTFEIFPFIWELGAFSEEPLSDFSQVPIGSKLQLKIQPKSEEGYKIKRIVINGEEQDFGELDTIVTLETEFKKLRGNTICIEFEKNQEAPQGSINLMSEENGHTEFYKELENGERSHGLSDTELESLEVGTRIKLKSFDDPGYYTKEIKINNESYQVDSNNELEFSVEEGSMTLEVFREIETSSAEIAQSKVKIGTSKGEIIIMPQGEAISNLIIYNSQGEAISYTGAISEELRVRLRKGVYFISYDENRKRVTKKVLVE